MNTFVRFLADRKAGEVTVISCENVKTTEGYALLNFEAVILASEPYA